MALHLLHGPVPVNRQSPIVVRRGSVLSLKLKEPDPTQVRVLKVPGSGEYAPARSVGVAEASPLRGYAHATSRSKTHITKVCMASQQSHWLGEPLFHSSRPWGRPERPVDHYLARQAVAEAA